MKLGLALQIAKAAAVLAAAAVLDILEAQVMDLQPMQTSDPLQVEIFS